MEEAHLFYQQYLLTLPLSSSLEKTENSYSDLLLLLSHHYLLRLSSSSSSFFSSSFPLHSLPSLFSSSPPFSSSPSLDVQQRSLPSHSSTKYLSFLNPLFSFFTVHQQLHSPLTQVHISLSPPSQSPLFSSSPPEKKESKERGGENQEESRNEEREELERKMEGVRRLEEGLSNSAHNFQFKLYLIREYLGCGGFNEAFSYYKTLEIKHIQQDTLTFLIFYSSITNFSPQYALGLCNKIIDFHQKSFLENQLFVIKCYNKQSYSRIDEFKAFSSRLSTSYQYALVQLECIFLSLDFYSKELSKMLSSLFSFQKKYAEAFDLSLLHFSFNDDNQIVEDWERISFASLSNNHSFHIFYQSSLLLFLNLRKTCLLLLFHSLKAPPKDILSLIEKDTSFLSKSSSLPLSTYLQIFKNLLSLQNLFFSFPQELAYSHHTPFSTQFQTFLDSPAPALSESKQDLQNFGNDLLWSFAHHLFSQEYLLQSEAFYDNFSNQKFSLLFSSLESLFFHSFVSTLSIVFPKSAESRYFNFTRISLLSFFYTQICSWFSMLLNKWSDNFQKTKKKDEIGNSVFASFNQLSNLFKNILKASLSFSEKQYNNQSYSQFEIDPKYKTIQEKLENSHRIFFENIHQHNSNLLKKIN